MFLSDFVYLLLVAVMLIQQCWPALPFLALICSLWRYLHRIPVSTGSRGINLMSFM